MARANIDLSWLAGLLTKTPTAANSVNPDYNQEDSIPYTDPVTGQTSGVMPNNTPYTPPTQWQRLVHSDQANAIDALNNQAVSKPLSASLSNASDIRVRSGNYARLPSSLQVPNLSPTEAAVAGYGEFNPPTILNQQNRAVMDAQGGVPSTLAATDVTQAGTGLKAAVGEAGRQDVQESILDQDTLNHWFTAFHLTPLQSQLAEKQLKSETGVQPLVAQIRERALQNQQQQEEHLVPAQTQLSLTQTENAQRQASEVGTLWPYAKTALDNRMIGESATSHYLPEMDRFGNTIQPDGSIKPFTKNPLGASPFAVQMQSLGDLTGAGAGQTIKSADGKHTYTIPAAPPSNIDPLTGGSVSKSFTTPTGTPTITSTNGPTVTHDTTGSMSPPVTHGLSTLPQSSTTSTVDAFDNERDSAIRHQQQQIVGGQLQQLLKKYSADQQNFYANTVKAPITGGGIDVEGLTDFMSNNLSKMTKEDRKTALSLLHKIQ